MSILRPSGRAGLLALALCAALQPAGAAGQPSRDPVQDRLDALTRHDLCARSDAELRSLTRALGRRTSPRTTGALR